MMTLPRLRAAILASLLLAVAFLPGCIEAVADGAFNGGGTHFGKWSSDSAPRPTLLTTLGDPSSSGVNAWPGQIDNIPEAFDIDGDGHDEVIVHSTDTNVYVFDPTTGDMLATIPTKYPAAWHVERVLNGVKAGVLNPGEEVSLVITNHAAYVAVWTFDRGASTDGSFVFQKKWETRMDKCHRSPGMDAEAAVGDLDGDGSLEIVVQTEETGFFALNNDGSIRWHHCWAGGNSAPVIDDMEDDGIAEVIIASDSGFVAVFNGDEGHPLWTFSATDLAYGIDPGSVPVSPTVAELDGVSPKEILFIARHAPADDEALFPTFHMAIFAVHRNADYKGELLWMRQPDWANPLSYTKLVVADVDDDGNADIFGMDWNTIGHRPGDWERLGPANVFRLDHRGNDVWVRGIDSWWSNQEILLSDSDGDGNADILVNGPGDGGDGLWRLSAETGEKEGFLGLAPWKMQRGAHLVDLHHDDNLQLLVPVTPMEPAPRGAVLVFELHDATRMS